MDFLHFFIAGTIITFTGYMIFFHDKAEWIAGYQEESVKNRKQLTQWIGGIILVMGICLLITPLIYRVIPEVSIPNFLVFNFIVLGGTIMAIAGQSVK